TARESPAIVRKSATRKRTSLGRADHTTACRHADPALVPAESESLQVLHDGFSVVGGKVGQERMAVHVVAELLAVVEVLPGLQRARSGFVADAEAIEIVEAVHVHDEFARALLRLRGHHLHARPLARVAEDAARPDVEQHGWHVTARVL